MQKPSLKLGFFSSYIVRITQSLPQPSIPVLQPLPRATATPPPAAFSPSPILSK